MKALYSTMILSCTLFASCTNDELVSEGIINDGQGIKVTASLANGSRTTYEEVDGFTKTLWEAGDALGLFTKTEHLEYTAKEAGASTTFTPADAALTAEDGTTVYAYYPYTKGASETAVTTSNNMQKWTRHNTVPTGESNYSSTLPVDFIYTSGTVKDNALSLTKFKHAYAFIKLTIAKEVLHYDTNNEAYTLVVTAKDAVISDFMPMTFDVTTEKFSAVQYAWNITYTIPKTAFDDNGKATCYIAILPTEVEGDEISFYKSSKKDENLMGTKNTPAGGLVSGTIYPLELKAKPTEAELALQGTYEYSVKNSKDETETGTIELVAAGDHTFTMKGLPGQPEWSITLNYSEEDGKERLTMKNWQLLEKDPLGKNSGQETLDTRLNLMESATIVDMGWFGTMKDVVSSKDPTVTYVADRVDEGTKITFTFRDNGGFDDSKGHHDVKGFAYNIWSEGGPSGLKGWYYDLVLTKKADSSSGVDEVSGSISDMTDHKW